MIIHVEPDNLGEVVAQLVKQGLTFTAALVGTTYRIELTGGY